MTLRAALRGLAAALALSWLLLAVPGWADDVAVPTLGARVTDLTGTLTNPQIAALEQKLAAFEQQKGSQIAVLIVPTTQPETIDQYSIRVVDAWKLGRKKVDDGALLLVSKNDHQLRIEVGYGLEGVLPDAIANRIIDEIIVPDFRKGDFYGGINDGILHMMGVIQGEQLPPPPAVHARQAGGGNIGANLLVPFFILFSIGHVLRRLMGTGSASAIVGAGTGLFAFFILGSLALAAGAGLLAIIAALALYSGAAGGLPMIGGFGGGGFGGGGFGGGGGFSGGGGGFGGGGASGSW
ncbi:MAG: TPM domain-containing protein [Stenotrophobium sp.]